MAIPKNALIFLVDDDLIMLEILDRHLELHQYSNIRRFSTGEEMLEAIGQQPFMAIVDYRLSSDEGKMNGYDLFHQIRSQSPQTKVVMLSAQQDGELVIKLIKQGLRDYIIKDSHMLNELTTLLQEG
jgi:DNA-binding NarL/FixJ family response regulator